MADYPEHEKLEALNGANEVVGRFIEWIGSQPDLAIGEWQTEIEEPCRWHEAIDVPDHLADESGRYRSAVGLARVCYGGRLYIAFSHLNDEDQAIEEVGPCPQCNGTGYRLKPLIDHRLVPAGIQTSALLARYFGIDEKALEAEKRAMIHAMRMANQ